MQLFSAAKYLVNLFNDHPLVHTITTTESSNIDFQKMNIYPLVNVELIDSYYDDLQTFNFEVQIYQQREVDKNFKEDLGKYDGDNTIDNMNECNTIMYQVLNQIKQNNNVELINSPTFTYRYNIRHNGLDGLVCLISLVVFDKNNTLC